MKIAVTGATGYVGKRFIHFATLAGHNVLALTRSEAVGNGVSWQKYNLEYSTPIHLPPDIDVVIHLAAVTKFLNNSVEKELEAAKLLISASNLINAKFIFISSQTAHESSPTQYGRIKWLIEKMTLDARGIVIRPGQIYGGSELGLFGLLCTIIKKMPILPAFLPAPTIQPIHVDDFAKSLLATMNQSTSSVLSIASPENIKFTQFLKTIARSRIGCHPIFIPTPILLIQLIARIIGANLSSKFGLDRLQSLFRLEHMNTASDLQLLGVTLRPLGAGMTRSGLYRRELFREGHAFLAYVLRTKPEKIIVRRYVKAIELLKIGEPLLLPELILNNPALLALLDGNKTIKKSFLRNLDWRLNIAMTLVESSPQGYPRFLQTDKSKIFLISFMLIIFSCLKEVVRRLLHLILFPILSRINCIRNSK